MRFHCGISFSWRTIKKYLIPILIGLLTAFGLGFLGVNADSNVYEVTPSDVTYKNTSVAPYTFTPNYAYDSTSHHFFFSPNNTNMNAFDFTLYYDLSNYCSESNHKGYISGVVGMYSYSNGGRQGNIDFSMSYLGENTSLSYSKYFDGTYVNYTTQNIDFTKTLKIVANSSTLSTIDSFSWDSRLIINCQIPDPEPEPCPDCPDCPDGNCCQDNTEHSEFSNYVYYFDDRTTTNGLLSNIYILLFLYCIGMLTLKFINIVRNTRWK